MNIKHFMAVIVTLVIILAGCSNSGSNDSGNKSSDSNKKDNDKKQELQISAAASLGDVSKALEKNLKDHKNVDVSFNYGGSGALRQQIEKGAPVTYSCLQILKMLTC